MGNLKCKFPMADETKFLSKRISKNYTYAIGGGSSLKVRGYTEVNYILMANIFHIL